MVGDDLVRKSAISLGPGEARVDYVPAFCPHRPSLLPIGRPADYFGPLAQPVLVWADGKLREAERLEEGEVVTRLP